MNAKPKYQFLAILSGLLTIFAFSHLFHRVYQTRNTEHLAFPWILSVLSAQILLVLYGVMNHAYGIYIPAIIIISGLSYIIYIKIQNEI